MDLMVVFPFFASTIVAHRCGHLSAGYPLWLAFIYEMSGIRSPAVVQNVSVDTGFFCGAARRRIGVTTFRVAHGFMAGWIAALWLCLRLMASFHWLTRHELDRSGRRVDAAVGAKRRAFGGL